MTERKLSVFCLLVVGLFISILSGVTFAEPILFEETPHGIAHVSQEIIVKFKSKTTPKAIRRLNSEHGSSILAITRRGGSMKLRIPKGEDAEELVKRYKRLPEVEYAELNTVCQTFMNPNDTYYSYQWHLQLINMGSAWDTELGDPAIVVAPLDTGVAYENYGSYYQAPDLAGTVFVPGYDFINNDAHPNDDNGHGTHVTGTIAQTTNNSMGVAGIAHNCSIMPVKVLDEWGYGTATSLADGIYWAVDNGARVINMSLGWPSGVNPGATVADAISYAYANGVVLVAAAGNDGVASVSYPAAFPEVIAVGATHSGDGLAYYSQYGDALELVAPGGDDIDRNGDGYSDGVLQQTFGGGTSNFVYQFRVGTSMATPHVSGLAALLLSQDAARIPEQVRQILADSAVDLGPAGWDSQYGYGRIDASAALNQTPPNEPPVAVISGPTTGTAGAPVTFDGSGSYDPETDPLSYLWNLGDGTTSTAMNPTHTYAASAVYIVTLTVNDGAQDSTPVTHTIDIAAVNKPPAANAGSDQSANDSDGNGVESVTLNGSASNDSDGVIAAYKWTKGATVLGTAAVVNYNFAVGIHTVTLTVTDNKGASASDNAVITLNANKPPVAKAGADQSAEVGQTIKLDGSGSSDSDGTIASYAWDFGDGASGAGITTSHTYSVAGNYTVTLTVTDNGGATSSDTAVIQVNEVPPPPTTGLSIVSVEAKDARQDDRLKVKITIENSSDRKIKNAIISMDILDEKGDKVSWSPEKTKEKDFDAGDTDTVELKTDVPKKAAKETYTAVVTVSWDTQSVSETDTFSVKSKKSKK